MQAIIKPKPQILAEHAVNWYIGNYIENPNNALRENQKLMDSAFKEMEEIKTKLKGKKMKHREFLDAMKIIGIHNKYYRYQKPLPNNCQICKHLGIK